MVFLEIRKDFLNHPKQTFNRTQSILYLNKKCFKNIYLYFLC